MVSKRGMHTRIAGPGLDFKLTLTCRMRLGSRRTGPEGSKLMRNTRSAGSVSDRIRAEVTSWPGVHASPGDLGELSFKIGRREIGHLHGDRAAHFGFPKKIWADLRRQGRIV